MTTPQAYRATPKPPDELAPVLDWELFERAVFDWQQDQHVAIIGPTDQGKTNLARNILKYRSYIAYLAIKSEDDTLEGFVKSGEYQRVYDWPPTKGRGFKRAATWEDMPRRLVWPDAHDRRRARGEQQRVFTATLDSCWSSGRVCIVWDDFWYIVRILGMELDAKQNLLNARSSGSAQVIISQRAGGNRMVEMTDQPTWLFWFRESDPRNLQIMGPTSSVRRGFVENLDRFQALAENTNTHEMYRVTAPLLA